VSKHHSNEIVINTTISCAGGVWKSINQQTKNIDRPSVSIKGSEIAGVETMPRPSPQKKEK